MFAERLKELRYEKQISQMALSKEIGVSQATVAGWEIGRATPSPEMLIKIANFYNVSADHLLGREFVQTQSESLPENKKNLIDKICSSDLGEDEIHAINLILGCITNKKEEKVKSTSA